MEDPRSRIIKKFSYQLPTKIIFGLESYQRIGEEIRKLNRHRALVVTDQGIRKAGIIDLVEGSLKKAGVNHDLYDEVIPDPTIESVEKTLAVVKEKKPDVLVAVGGGSSIDTAKLAGALDVSSLTLPELEGIDKIGKQRRLPLIAVETAAGTGSEVTTVAPVVDTTLNRKLVIIDVQLAPDVAICDPLLTVSMPAKVTAETGIDALSHALECYVTHEAWDITDALSIYSAEMVFRYLRRAVFWGEDIKAREKMLMASLIAGMAFPHAGTGMVHGMGHALGCLCKISHGATMGILMPYVEEYNLSANYRKFAHIAKIAGEYVDGLSVEEAARKTISALKKLAKDIGIPTMKQVGVTNKDLNWLTEQAFTDEINMPSSPRPMSREDIFSVFKKALEEKI